MKSTVDWIAAVGIIFFVDDPGQIFIDTKDNTHPMKHARLKLAPVGGNWIGDKAKLDVNPRGSFIREFDEELTFEREDRRSLEYALLGVADEAVFEPTSINEVNVTEEDKTDLAGIKEFVRCNAMPWADFINAVPKSVLDRDDPENQRDGYTALVSYNQVAFPDELWQKLVRLQLKFGNLSNESVATLTTFEDIVKRGLKTAFAHDHVLRRFFLSKGLSALDFPIVEGTSSLWVGEPLATYEAYLERYRVLKKP